jgi:Na+/H+-translocating membrane pyrophosphatase
VPRMIIVRFLLTSFVSWLIAAISLLAIFILEPQQSRWFYPLIIALFVIVGIVATVIWLRTIRNWWKSSA